MTLRSFLYAFVRLLGDVNAIQRGPKAIGKRAVRKAAGRAYGRASSKWLR